MWFEHYELQNNLVIFPLLFYNQWDLHKEKTINYLLASLFSCLYLLFVRKFQVYLKKKKKKKLQGMFIPEGTVDLSTNSHDEPEIEF